MTTRQILAKYLGQGYPTPCPRADEPVQAAQNGSVRPSSAALGRAMDIREVARVIGCSPWTVRHRHMPKGLPFFRSGAGSKLIFYEEQIVRWIQKTQGGNTK
jgi:hypothetical protein